MLAIITKASDDYWYTFKEIKKIEDVLKIYHKVIIDKNYYSVNDIPYWEGFKKEDAPLLKQAKIHIIIYDTWIE